MKFSPQQVLADGLQSGVVAALSSAALIALRGQIENKNPLAPINAISHIAWDDEAFDAKDLDIKHTLVGLSINDTAMITWGVIFEAFRVATNSRGDAAKTIGCGATVSVLAWLLDYKIVPPRLTPGVEAHLSKRSIAMIYVGLAMALSGSALWRDQGEKT